MQAETPIAILASRFGDKYIAEEILDTTDPFSSLEYGDVYEGEYQVWEYPSGKIYQIKVDREVDNNLYYSTPSTNKGTVWQPKLVLIGEDADGVMSAYRTLQAKV